MPDNTPHFMTTVRFETLDDLLPTMEIHSGSDAPYDYAVMTPDYKWHYYRAYEASSGTRYRPVTVTGEPVVREGAEQPTCDVAHWYARSKRGTYSCSNLLGHGGPHKWILTKTEPAPEAIKKLRDILFQYGPGWRKTSMMKELNELCNDYE